MSKRRGLSLEEKRSKLLEIFHESQDFYLLKEVEKRGPSKGVISQSVKDVLQSLVDDDLVFRDKIGTSVYFWSLPSHASNKLRQVHSQLSEELSALNQQQQSLKSRITAAKRCREENASRTASLLRLKELEVKNKELKARLASLAENDPEVFESKRKWAKVAHEAVNRWTDNIFALQHWCNEKCQGDEERLSKFYSEVGINEDVDYVT